jgi:hypothetical protein
MTKKSKICIMTDFGMGPYAWLRGPELTRSRVGQCIADAVTGFPKEYGVSENLQRDFAEWVIDFEKNYDHVNFDWEEWNHVGIELARKLKKEIGDQFLVEYHYPHEDPRYDAAPPIIEI